MMIQELVAAGAAISGPQFSAHVVALAEVLGEELFWVMIFPEDQQGAHRLRFTSQQTVGEIGIAFYQGPQLVAYLALIEEFPELDPMLDRATFNKWKEYLKDPEKMELFQDFVAYEKGE